MLDNQLKDHEWLAADQYTIADIANFSWVMRCHFAAEKASVARSRMHHCDYP